MCVYSYNSETKFLFEAQKGVVDSQIWSEVDMGSNNFAVACKIIAFFKHAVSRYVVMLKSPTVTSLQFSLFVLNVLSHESSTQA